MDWDKLRIFYHIASSGSFTQANKVLHTSQSALSRQIAHLEEALGYQLFERHARGLHLTPKGQLLFKAAEEVYQKVQTTQLILAEKQVAPCGSLIIETSYLISYVWIRPYIEAFLKQYPDMRISIIGNDGYSGLHNNKADVGIRPHTPHLTGYAEQYLTTFNFRPYASPEYINEFGKPHTLKDLAKHRLLAFGEYRSPPYEGINYLLQTGSKPGEQHSPYLTVNCFLSLAQFVEKGVGIAALPAEVLPSLSASSSKFIPILPELPGRKIDLFYVYPEELRKSQRITALGDFLFEHLNKAFTLTPAC